MSIWDNVKKFAQPYSDDEYDDYDDYEDEFEEEVEEEPVRRAPRRAPARAPRAARKPAPQREPAPVEEDEEFEDDYETAFNAIPKAANPAPAASAAPVTFPGKVVSSKRANAQEIVRFRPTTFQDSRKAATDLVAAKAVIVNLEDLDKDSARRMVDFLSGVVFAMDGEVQKIAQGAYVFCPPNVFITGGQDEVQTAAEEIL